MDLYLPSTEPGMTLQEMIECDIKSGISFEDGFPLDSLVTSHDLNSLDLSGMSTLEAELDLKTFEPLFDPLDRLDDMDVIVKEEIDVDTDRFDTDEEDEMHDTVASWMNFSSMTNYNLDIENSVMVDPSSVIPSTLPSRAQHRQQQQQSNLLLRSPSTCSLPASSARTPLLSSTITSGSSTTSGGDILGASSHLPQHLLQTVKKEENTTQMFRSRIGPNNLPGSSNGQAMATQVVLCPVNTISSTSPTLSTLAAKNTTSLSSSKLVNSGVSTTKLVSSGLASNKLLNGESGHIASPLLSSNAKSSTVVSSTLSQQHHNHVSAVVSTSNTTNSSSTFHQHSTISQNGRPTLHGLSRIGHFQSSKSSNGIISTSKAKYTKFKRDKLPEEKVFPKPAYSYSCLIALALKNSNSGSLPVSEIYSFMCEHFPYFRTAPNGWKNSVRHNLSLNKCFEKIEKPVVSGGNQRKGCLWALNPERAHKMDDEVQKWSKKGLQEIKQSMTYPEVLESLERGEMKFETSSGASSSCSEDDEEDFEEVEPLAIPEISSAQTIHPLKIATPVSTAIVASGGLKAQHGRILTGSVRSIGYLQQPPHSPLTAGTLVSTTQHQQISRGTITHQGVTQIQIRKPLQVTSSAVSNAIQEMAEDRPTTDYIRPPQTLSEINIQSNGSIVDDFGNEIPIEGDMGGILNPGGSSSGSGGSLILRQTSLGTTIRTTPLSATNFSYTSSPLSSPHHHHHHHQSTLNRLVLTSAKQS